MNKTIFNLFAALAFIFAALATSSAYAVGAAAWTSTGPRGISETFVSHNQPNNEAAISVALRLCNENIATTPCVSATDDAGEILIFSADNPSASCFNKSDTFPPISQYAVGATPAMALEIAAAVCMTVSTAMPNDMARDPSTGDCEGELINYDHDNDDSTALVLNVMGEGLCDETGIICPPNQFKDLTTTEICVDCPTTTHELMDVNGVETCVVKPKTNAFCVINTPTMPIYDSSDDSCRNPQSMAECMALNTEFDTGLPILNNNDTADNPTDDFCRPPQTNDECQTHEDLSIYDEGMMMCRSAVGTDCLNATNLRTQTPILQDGDCVAATTAAECKAASDLAALSPQRQFVATDAEGFAGGCAALSAEICSNTNEDATPTPIWQVNITTNIESCVAATAANHAGCLLIDNGTKPIPGVNGECRAAESTAECAEFYADSRSIAATTADLAGACVAPTAADCAATNDDATPTPILEGTICTAATNEGCLANATFAGRKPIAEDGRCVRANTPSDCATAHPDLPLLDLGNLGGCSANTAELCIAANDRRPIPNGGECIAAANDNQCRDNHGPNLPRAEFRNNTTTGRCVSCEAIDELRPFYNADTDQCELAHDNQDCRTANMDKPIATTDSQGNPAACRAVESINDCDADYPIYEVVNNVRTCSPLTAEICSVINPQLPLVSADGRECVAEPTPATASGGNGDGKGAVFAGAVAVGLWLFYNHYTAGEGVNWTPSYAYNSDNGNISYAVGSRWNATADNMKFYWQTSHNSGDGRISYGSGISYTDNRFGATMNTASDLDETTMDINLSAKTGGEKWQLSGGYNFDLQREEKQAKTETQNRLNIAANYRINQWQLSATANGNADVNGLSIIAKYELDRWILSATANADNDEAAAKVNYSYRF